MSSPGSELQGGPPLDGVRVIAIEQYGAGPYGSMILADLGAEVIKIEDPDDGGDVARYVPPYTGEQDSIYFQAFNRRKKSVALATHCNEGKQVLDALIRNADAVFTGLRGDQAASRGLLYSQLREVNPKIVCCHLTGFGMTGPRRDEPGYDYLLQAYTGWMSLTGAPGDPPTKSGVSVVDLSTGVAAALGVVTGLFRARATGQGGDIDVSLFDTSISMLSYLGAWVLSRGYTPERQANSAHPSQVPAQLFRTADGWIAVMCAKEKFYRRLVELLGCAHLAEDIRFADFAARMENRDALTGLLQDQFQSRSTGEWLAALRGRVPVAPVQTVEQALADPQTEASDMILSVDHPSFGQLSLLRAPIRHQGADPPLRRAPRLGEHSEEVLRDVGGYSIDAIADLRARGLVVA